MARVQNDKKAEKAKKFADFFTLMLLQRRHPKNGELFSTQPASSSSQQWRLSFEKNSSKNWAPAGCC
jgi:hypothetical protein